MYYYILFIIFGISCPIVHAESLHETGYVSYYRYQRRNVDISLGVLSENITYIFSNDNNSEGDIVKKIQTISVPLHGISLKNKTILGNLFISGAAQMSYGFSNDEVLVWSAMPVLKRLLRSPIEDGDLTDKYSTAVSSSIGSGNPNGDPVIMSIPFEGWGYNEEASFWYTGKGRGYEASSGALKASVGLYTNFPWQRCSGSIALCGSCGIMVRSTKIKVIPDNIADVVLEMSSILLNDFGQNIFRDEEGQLDQQSLYNAKAILEGEYISNVTANSELWGNSTALLSVGKNAYLAWRKLLINMWHRGDRNVPISWHVVIGGFRYMCSMSGIDLFLECKLPDTSSYMNVRLSVLATPYNADVKVFTYLTCTNPIMEDDLDGSVVPYVFVLSNGPRLMLFGELTLGSEVTKNTDVGLSLSLEYEKSIQAMTPSKEVISGLSNIVDLPNDDFMTEVVSLLSCFDILCGKIIISINHKML